MTSCRAQHRSCNSARRPQGCLRERIAARTLHGSLGNCEGVRGRDPASPRVSCDRLQGIPEKLRGLAARPGERYSSKSAQPPSSPGTKNASSG